MIIAKSNVHSKRTATAIVMVILLVIAFSCSTKTARNDSADTLKPVLKIDSVDSNNTKGENFKNYLMDEKVLDPAIRKFVASINRIELAKIIDNNRQFVIITPGPGVQPIYTFGQSLEDLLGLNEILLLLSDSSSLVTTTFYNLAKDKCELLEEFPDGIYVKDFNFIDRMDALRSNSDDESINKKVNATLDILKGEKGTELLIKFSDKNLSTLFLDFYVYKRGDGYFIAFLDQRNCGA